MSLTDVRATALEMAVRTCGSGMSPDVVLQTAERFYRFLTGKEAVAP